MEGSPCAVSIALVPYSPEWGKPTAPDSSPWAPLPRDFVLWSFFNTVFCNPCCLGFLALAFSIKARDCKVLGDMSGTVSYGKTAKYLNITILVLIILLIMKV
uniref:Interferon induced transmembrane protein 3 n=1 Tax=Crocodylus porosus TaxID=8502 RepID=A0A7M4EQH3_CROPO